MDMKLATRYLMGMVTNREIKNMALPRSIIFEDDRHKIIAEVLSKLMVDKSEMTYEIIMAHMQNKVSEVAGREEWTDNKDWFNSFISVAMDSEVTDRECEELYELLQRQIIGDQARILIQRLLDNDEFSEQVITEALDKLRLLKAVYPSKSAQLNEQMAQAVHDALNNSAGIIPYGFGPIDELMAGVFRKEITIVAGRPGHGKTSLICQFVLNWILQNIKVLFISKEMPAERLIHKFLSNIGNISSDEIKKGEVADHEYLNSVASAFLNKYKENLFIYDDVYTIAETERLILKHKPDIVIDDFIQLSDFQGVDNRVGIGSAMKTYKRLAKENDFAMVVISQLSREIEKREDPVPRMSDLSESGALEQLAAYVCFIYYEYKVTYEPELKNRSLFIAAKTRFGESAKIELGFDGGHMRYYAVPNFGRS
jgi:replicative DNA helicase